MFSVWLGFGLGLGFGFFTGRLEIKTLQLHSNPGGKSNDYSIIGNWVFSVGLGLGLRLGLGLGLGL